MSTKAVVYAALGLLVALTILLVINRPGRNSSSALPPPAPAVSTSGNDAAGPNLVIRVDGEEVQPTTNAAASTRLSDMPLDAITPSLISHVRVSGTTEVLVLTDGSEITVGAHNIGRLPESVQYRLEYDRSDR